MLSFLNQKYESLQNKKIVIAWGRNPTIAADLMIVSNGFKKIGYYCSDYLEPSVGYLNKNVDSGSLGLPAELYALNDVVIFQIRTVVRHGRRADLAKELISALTSRMGGKAPQILCLASLPFKIRPDLEIQSIQKHLYFYSSEENLFPVKQLVDIKTLLNEEEEQKQVLGETMIMKQLHSELIKHNGKIFGLFIFPQQGLLDENAIITLTKGVRQVTGWKQLSEQTNLSMLG